MYVSTALTTSMSTSRDQLGRASRATRFTSAACHRECPTQHFRLHSPQPPIAARMATVQYRLPLSIHPSIHNSCPARCACGRNQRSLPQPASQPALSARELCGASSFRAAVRQQTTVRLAGVWRLPRPSTPYLLTSLTGKPIPLQHPWTGGRHTSRDAA